MVNHRYFESDFAQRTGRAITALRMAADNAATPMEHLQALAWDAMQPLFREWSEIEDTISNEVDPMDVVWLRRSTRLRPELDLLRYCNFPEAARLLDKDFPMQWRLERSDESSPGAPPAMQAIFDRKPAARGPFTTADIRAIEALDHAMLRISFVDVVRGRIATAAASIMPDIKARLAGRGPYLILDIGCGGNLLGRMLRQELLMAGVATTDLSRVRIVGVDSDARASAYSYASECPDFGWNLRSSTDIDLRIVPANFLDSATLPSISEILCPIGRWAFDATVALGILDYVDCPMPDQRRRYFPAVAGGILARRMEALTEDNGLVIGCVGAAEADDATSRGARHLFFNWHLARTSLSTMRSWFPFAAPEEFRGVAPADRASAALTHVVVHRKS